MMEISIFSEHFCSRLTDFLKNYVLFLWAQWNKQTNKKDVMKEIWYSKLHFFKIKNKFNLEITQNIRIRVFSSIFFFEDTYFHELLISKKFGGHRVSFNNRRASNKRHPLISTTPLGVHIERSASPLIGVASLNAAVIRIVTIFH